MTGEEIRNANWTDLRDRVSGLRATVHNALMRQGPCTTRFLAERASLDILTVRPRVTELVDLGFAECVGRKDGEGVYRALSFVESAKKYSERQAIARGEGVQTQLGI